MSHDACCPLDHPAVDCAVCEAIAVARGQEKLQADQIWRDNLGLIERRNYLAGYADGAAGHAPKYP